ncbi:MAG: hypothetical protein CVU84_12585 [Firmicutes bacterium HGW-Firmicutes-1]|nr:MAG: hypothetical protein CVU84_12585 [Firmicutes bacterium HGW-Firmicutes-1]
MNKNVKKSSGNTYAEDKNKKLETKLKVKKDIIKTNQMYNKVLKDLDIQDLQTFEDVEYELLEQKAKNKK